MKEVGVEVPHPGEVSSRPRQFSPIVVNRAIKNLLDGEPSEVGKRWLSVVARKVCNERPDLSGLILDYLAIMPAEEDFLAGMTIGEISVCYEALLSEIDPSSRRGAGQFFTPDDAAKFMAEQSNLFPPGIWLDPCCGVGNLSWHLAQLSESPSDFISNSLILIDRDEIALKSAVVLLASQFLSKDDRPGFERLTKSALCCDFLISKDLPNFDFVIANPPYVRDIFREEYVTRDSRETFAYFLEKIANDSKGFIAVTPSSYLSSPKFNSLRLFIENSISGGDIYVFDNVPDTLFRGYKYGSHNTSKTNFVRAAITVCPPGADAWRITPIIRWKSASRAKMWEALPALLARRQIGPSGEWAKISKQLYKLWESLAMVEERLADLIIPTPSSFSLTVALTPRYYISAAYRELRRGSKLVLYFRSEFDRDRAAIVLNSSIPYFWWRALDGGVTLPRRVLYSVPIPRTAVPDEAIVEEIKADEEFSLTVKLNAGKENENIKRPKDLIRKLNRRILGGDWYDLSILYSEDMFS